MIFVPALGEAQVRHCGRRPRRPDDPGAGLDPLTWIE